VFLCCVLACWAGDELGVDAGGVGVYGGAAGCLVVGVVSPYGVVGHRRVRSFHPFEFTRSVSVPARVDTP